MNASNLTIRKTTSADIDTVLSMYEAARKFMAESGNLGQWQNGYPSHSTLEVDIAAGASFVCEDGGEVVGTFAYFFGDRIDPNYSTLRGGTWLDEEPYGVVHRITTKAGTHGVGTFCLDWAFEQCHRLRIDTHHDNTPMQNLIKKCGFVYCGVVTMTNGDGSDRDAFMKV